MKNEIKDAAALATVQQQQHNTPHSHHHHHSHEETQQQQQQQQPSSIEKLKQNVSVLSIGSPSGKRRLFTVESNTYELSDKIDVLKCDNQIKELHTVIRDRETSHSDFKFYSDRLVCVYV